MNKSHLKIAVIAIIAIGAAIASTIWLLLPVAPDLPPRNIRILVGRSRTGHYTFFNVDGKNLDVMVFSTSLIWDDELGEFGIRDREPFDMDLLTGFHESFYCLGLGSSLRFTDRPYGILYKWSDELSGNELKGIWQKIDNLVVSYEEPELQLATSSVNVRAVVDDEFYWSRFFWDESARSHNFNFRRRDRRRYITDRNLLILTHYLADLAPIPMGWQLTLSDI